ncbi:MAG: TlpA disulfide reductase family protein [Bacteroidota bacterium]|nr:TlpA disulfide reductase family protein [Bacteroidota bacterium]
MQHVTVQDVLSLIRPNPDTVRIINFWATTCRPCVEELPYFERIYRAYAIPVGQAKPVQVVLVSLDFARDVQAKVIPFVQKHGLTAKVVFWGTPKSEEIEAVDTQWTGAIPATIIVGTREGQRQFLEKKLSFEELENLVKMYIFP